METLEIEQRQTRDRVGTLPLLSVIDLVTETPSSDCFWNIHCLKHIPLTDRMLSWDLQSNKQEPLHDCPVLRLPPWRWREGTGWWCECNPLSECWHVEPHPSPPPLPLLCSSYCYCFPNTPQRATTLRQWTTDNAWTNFNIDLSIPRPGRILTDNPPGCDTSWLNSLNFQRSRSSFITYWPERLVQWIPEHWRCCVSKCLKWNIPNTICSPAAHTPSRPWQLSLKKETLTRAATVAPLQQPWSVICEHREASNSF